MRPQLNRRPFATISDLRQKRSRILLHNVTSLTKDISNHEFSFGQVRRAGHIADDSPGPRGINGRIEQLSLNGCECREIFRSAAPARLRVTAKRPESGARYVDKHSIELLRSPGLSSGIAGDHVRTRAVQGMRNKISPVAVLFYCCQLRIALEGNSLKYRRLATWARAHVEPGGLRAGHLCARQRECNQLTSFVLHSDDTASYIREISRRALGQHTGQG